MCVLQCVFGGVGVHVYGMWPKIDLFSGSKNPAVYVYYTTCSWNFNSSKVVFYGEINVIVLLRPVVEYCISVCQSSLSYIMQHVLPMWEIQARQHIQ